MDPKSAGKIVVDNGLLTKMILLALLPCRLNQEECERALLPTLEHASMVHSHVHHLNEDHDEAFAQTRNAIVYISVSFLFYGLLRTF